MSFTVSTKTFVIYLIKEIKINLQDIYDKLELSDESISIKFQTQRKGETSTAASNFLKCVSISMIYEKNKFGIKLFGNGSLQITGCKNTDHCLKCIDFIYSITFPDIILRYYMVPVMMNVNFTIGFDIDRNKFAQYLHDECNVSITPIRTTSGLRFKLVERLTDIIYNIYEYHNNTNKYIGDISYCELFGLDKRTSSKKLNKQCLTCVSISKTGKVLLSGINDETIQERVNWLKFTIDKVRDVIEIKPNTNPIITFR